MPIKQALLADYVDLSDSRGNMDKMGNKSGLGRHD